MHRFITLRRTLVSVVALLCLLAATFGAMSFKNAQAANATVSLSNSVLTVPAGAHLTSQMASSQQLTITLVLKSGKESQMNSLLTSLYTPGNSQYHKWLAKGQFNALFAPAPSQIKLVENFLTKAGLTLVSTPTPFFVRAKGTTAQIQAAFHTTINNYVAANSQPFFQNDSLVQIPVSLSGLVTAVSGLTNTVRQHAHYTRNTTSGKTGPHYGAGPGGSGLAPSQTASLYNANPVYKLGAHGQGDGATLAVFELSGYTQSDITAYEHQFFGPSENVQLVNINVDGGPLTPNCPTGDSCGPFGPPPCANGCNSADYSGDIEVNADIETQLALAPKVDRLLVYNAPNDLLGLTPIDEYVKIAADDQADSISSSWGACEKDATFPIAAQEFVAFEQMAFQGQSMFSSAGDTGPFDCLRGSGFKGLTVDDPTSQPFVTSVGGTSFVGYDPGQDLRPAYPNGQEEVWNVLDMCSAGNLAGCAQFGAGGGGVSSFWAKPGYQYGPGVINSLSQKGTCLLAEPGQYCRQVPDISANADEFTPYAEFCTGNSKTNSTCATFSATQPAPGWFGIGGTSLSSPVWSAVIALADAVHHERFGNANFGLYKLFRSDDAYGKYFHDITGQFQTDNNNGFYPTTPNYDMATGIGTPIISGIVFSNF